MNTNYDHSKKRERDMSEKIFPLELTKDTAKLKELIQKHPDYPIVVLAGESSNYGDYYWMYCNEISFEIAEILDCESPYDNEVVCTDRNEFKKRLEEWLWDELGGNDKPPKIAENEFQEKLKVEKAKYEPYWKKVIAIFAYN